ncbi:MAG TPA: DUF5060 domain-containing protein, partial [Tepidisphaeraceae bacterium]|nr:DUF5060 domain-containing protein [Tepidisphaeraceae bacterium]
MARLFAFIVIASVFLATTQLDCFAASSVEQWDVFDLQLNGSPEGNPFIDVNISARFSNGADTVSVPGFYDGDGVYRIRFAPPRRGEWSYVTQSNRPELDGQRGSVTATAATGDNHGPVRVRDTFHFAYADGAPYFECGTTCYAWT